MKKLLYLLPIMTLMIGCAGSLKPIKISCPPKPEMAPVNVVNHSLSGKDLDNAIDNHIKLWKYIHEIEKLGCRR